MPPRSVAREPLRALMAGTGFALAFGWAWFEPLNALSLGDALSGSLFSGGGATAFAAAMALVFLAGALGVGRFLDSPQKRRGLALGLAAHLTAFLLTLSLFLPRAEAWRLTTGAALGLAEGLGGIYWLAVILRLPPRHAPLAAASAGLAATVLGAALAMASGSSAVGPYGPRIALPASLLLALFIAWRLTKPAARENAPAPPKKEEKREAGNSFQGNARRLPPSPIWFFAPAVAFFALGALTGAWADASGDGAASWPICGLEALGAFLALPVFLAAEKRRFSPIFLALAFIVPLAASLVPLPAFIGPSWLRGIYLPLLGGFLEGLAAALLALRLGAGDAGRADAPGAAVRLGGRALLTALVLVNAGFFVGVRLALWSGREYAGLFWLIPLGLALLASTMHQGRGRRGEALKEAAEEPRATAMAERAGPALDRMGLPDNDLQKLFTDWGLTPKERSIAVLLRSGLSNPEIAAGAGISENTLRIHLKNLYRKSGAPDRNALKLLLAVRSDGPTSASVPL